jgi:integrase
MLTFVRKSELLGRLGPSSISMRPVEYPAERMKMKDPHSSRPPGRGDTPTLQPLACGSQYVLPNLGSMDKPMGHSTVNVAFDRIGYGGTFTPHGLRATASTILNEHGFRPDVIERQLAHTERNRVRAAYNQAEYLEERRQMMQHWADFIDALCAGKNAVGFPRAAAQ